MESSETEMTLKCGLYQKLFILILSVIISDPEHYV